MNENSMSYAVERKNEGRYAFLKIGLIALYILVVLGFFVAIYITRLVPVFAMCPFLTWILWLATWRYTQVTYEYSIEVGDVSFARIYGNRSRREVLKLHIREVKAVHPAEDERGGNYAKVYDFRGNAKTPDAYCLVFCNEKEERCLVYFEATRKAIKLLSLYNSSAVSGRKELRY